MLPSREYLCPKECPRRESHCHESCEQHAKYRAAIEEEREARLRASIADSLKEAKYIRRFES